MVPVPVMWWNWGKVGRILIPASRICFDVVGTQEFFLVRQCTSSIAAMSVHTTKDGKKPFERLPKTVIPVNYAIELKPNLKTLGFEGKECISVEVKDATNKVILNTADLKLKNVKYTSADGSEKVPSAVDICEETETVTISFSQPLLVGPGTFSIDFVGELSDYMRGFYRSKYTSPEGDTRYAACTQFESCDARRCFPCWDEPAFKATFDMSLVVPVDRVALSNMPVISENLVDEGLRVVKFQKTPIMSTYLVAVIVGEFDFVEGKSEDGVLVRVYTPVGCKEQGLFALQVGIKVLPYYKEYFKVAYPLPKLDMVALADFAQGAMENWGLLTYREVCLLVDPKNTSMLTKQRAALTIGHEIAHMWFGNLVTPEWWTDLWLKEGYASFIEYLCVANQFPEYDIWTQFVTTVHCSALELDCLKSSHPIEVPVNSPCEIDEIFDTISYLKGASLIRMLHQYIGSDDFRSGMRLYLKRHAYGNAQTKDLWAALEEASSKPIASVMSTWTSQMGFPVINVTSQQVGKNRKLTVSQNRFFADSGENSENYMWKVPLEFSTSADPSKVQLSYVLQERSGEVTLEGVDPDAWVKLNPSVIGFYRVHYPPEMLTQFIPAIQDKSLPPLDRLGLMSDLFAMVLAGHANTVEVLRLAEAFVDEDNYTVWSCLDSCFREISLILQDTDMEPQFNKYVCRLMQKAIQQVGWEPKPHESHLTTLLRPLLIWRLSVCGDEATLKEAKRRFDLHVAGKEILPADLRGPVYSASVFSGDEGSFNTLLEMYQKADMQEEKVRISRSLATVNNDALRSKVFEFALSDDVRKQDSVFVLLRASVYSKRGREMTWAFIKENWPDLCKRFPDVAMKAILLKGVVEDFASLDVMHDVQNFFATNSLEGVVRSMEQALESIKVKASWLARDKESITKFLSQYK